MADVRTFRAASMQEALDLVREELGADAVILHTRQLERRRFLPWRKAAQEVEITASKTLVAPPAEPKRAKKSSPSRPAQAESRRENAGNAESTRPSYKRLDLVSEPSESLADVLNRSSAESKSRPHSPADSRSPSPADFPLAAGRPEHSRPEHSRVDETPFAAPRNRFTGRPIGARVAAIDQADPTAALSRRLDAIQQMLHELGRSQIVRSHDDIPGELFQLYTELIDAEVEDERARELILKLKRSAAPRQLADGTSAKALLTAMVESEIRCCEPIAPQPGRRKVVALVGPTGVGKTTTIAKLAANFRLRSPVKMGLVTVDTYRVAAVEQLRIYAEIIDLPMKVVTSPLEMRRALDELIGLDLVLIDTAGRSPKDDLQIQELKSLLAEAHVDEVDLVLSMASSVKTLEASAAKFAAAGTTGLILTKLDEASGMGGLLSVARNIDLPIRYLTAGQDVPDDIEPAHPRRIARLILGQERASK